MNKVLSFAVLLSFITYSMDDKSPTTNNTRYLYDQSLEEHKKSIDSMVFNPSDSNQLISNSSDGTIKIWDLKNRRSHITISKDFPASKCAVSNDGQFIAYGDAFNKIGIIDKKKFETRHLNLPTIESKDLIANSIKTIIFDPKNSSVIVSALYGEEYNSKITFFNLDSNSEVVLKTERVNDIALDPLDGKTIVVASLARSKIYNIETLQPIHEFDDTQNSFKVMFNPSNPKVCAFFNFDEKWIKIFNRDEKKTIKKITIFDHQSKTQNIVFSPNGKEFLLTSEQQTHILDADTGNIIELLPNKTTFLGGIALKLKNKRSETPIKNGIHSSKMKNSLISPNGNTIATCSDDNTIKIWKKDN